MSITPTKAARKAVAWAEQAESAAKAAGDRRKTGDEWAQRRGGNNQADSWYERAAAYEQARSAAVEMANMWATVASILVHADPGQEPS